MIRNTWPLRISAAKWPADAIVSSRSTFICLVISQHLPITRTVPGERVANEGRDYQPAGQHRKGRRTSVKSHANLLEDLHARSHEAPRHAMDVFVDGLEAKRGIYRHGEERDEKGEQQARHGAGSEPDNEQGRYRDLRDHLRDNDNRVDAEAQEGRISNHDRDHDAADDRQYEAEHSEVELRPQMAGQ